MKRIVWAGLMAGLLAGPVSAEEIEEIVVTGPFHEDVTESAMPITVLSGEELRQRVSSSLGDTLKGKPGVQSASFGTGVGQPVIRGQSANRVQVLQNSVFVADASNQSQDHANGIEPLLADSIEVVRGPATLLYGSGAIGGVVNVIDQRVPSRLFDNPEIVLEQSHNSVSDENRTIFGANASFGSFSVHVDAYHRSNDNYNVPGFPVDEEALEALEELRGEEHDEEEEEEEEEEVAGFIDNSDGEASGGTFGVSYVQEDSFIGFSYNRFESDYGLPPGAHGHHEEGYDEDEEEHEEEEHEEEGDEFIRLDLVQERYDFKGDYHFDGGLFETVRFHVGYTDYEHSEIEFEGDEVETGTVFSHEGYDSRVTITTNERSNWQGVYGVQMNATEFSAVGEEAFIPETDIRDIAIFGVERLIQDEATFEFAARVERAGLESGSCDENETVFSFSGSAMRDLGDAGTVMAGLGRSERAPSVEEKFSNVDTSSCGTTADLVTHAATNLIEIGSASLDVETSVNFDIGYRYAIGAASIEVSAFVSQIDDYIYLELTGDEVDETLVAAYVNEDAEFIGLEALMEFPVYSGEGFGVMASFRADTVRAEFDNGTNVPRVPPTRIGFGLNWSGDNWNAGGEITQVFDQDRVHDLELETEGYTLFNLSADYRWDMENGAQITVFVRGENLMDELIRNHVSFTKNVAPEPGRAVRAGFRLNF